MTDTETPRIKVVIIDDHRVVADSLATSLGRSERIDVVGVASDGKTGIDAVMSLRPDVALVDFRLPDLSGSDVIRALRARGSKTRCVVLTGTGLDRALVEAVDAGAVGFVTKDERYVEVVEAIVAAANGEARFPPALLARVLPELSRGSDPGRRLTARERDVLACLANGRSNAEIGAELYISINTVRNHVANVLTKLEARSRGEAVAIAIREGLVSPDAC